MRKLILIISIIAGSVSAFAQNGETQVVDVTKTRVEGDVVLTSVEQMPSFPGGMSGLMDYLKTQVIYPEQAKKENVQGKVIVKFVVSKSGKVTNVQLLRDIGAGCGAEAVRVVKAMPDWKPGLQNGKPVNVYFTLPVSFKLSEPEPVTPEQSKAK